MNQQLFDEWRTRARHVDQPFVTDGAIDPDKWEAAPRRVAFLLKEAYDTDSASDGFDLPGLIRQRWRKLRGPTWRRIAQWAYLVQRFKVAGTPSFPGEAASLDDALLQAAVVNIRKSGGTKISDSVTIANYAESDGDLLVRQIEFLRPEIVVCGGTWTAANHLWPEAHEASDRFFEVGERVFINFWHPAVRWPNELLYFGLAGILAAGFSRARAGARAG